MNRRGFFKTPLFGVLAAASVTQCETSPAAVLPLSVPGPGLAAYQQGFSSARLFYVAAGTVHAVGSVLVLDRGNLRRSVENEPFVIENVRMRPPYQDEETDQWQIVMPTQWRLRADFMALASHTGEGFTRILKNRLGSMPITYQAPSARLVTNPEWAKQNPGQHMVTPRVLEIMSSSPLNSVSFSEEILRGQV